MDWYDRNERINQGLNELFTYEVIITAPYYTNYK